MVDSKNQFSAAQAVTTTADSTNVLDLGVANPNQGEGTPLILHIEVGTAVTASGAATVTFSLYDGATSGAITNLVWATGAIGKATLIKGYKVREMALPFTLQRFVKLTYTVATGPLTAGTFSAWLEPNA